MQSQSPPATTHPPKAKKLSRARRQILVLAASVPHITQPSQWDCGLTCVSMVLRSLKLYHQSDPLDLRLFVHRDAVENGSVWTIDLAYLFKAFGVSDFSWVLCIDFSHTTHNQANQIANYAAYYTSHIGVNFHYAQKSYYRSAFPTDSRRIHSLFADAHDSGVRVVPLLLPLDDIKRFLAIRVKRNRWQRLGLGWLCGNPDDVYEELAEEESNEYDVGVDSYLYMSEYNTGLDSGDEEDDEADYDSAIALPSVKQHRRSKKRRRHSKTCVHNNTNPHATNASPAASPAAVSSPRPSSANHDFKNAPRQFTEQTPLLDHSSSTQNTRHALYQSTLSTSYTSNAGHPLRRIYSNSSITTYRTHLGSSTGDSPEPFSIVKTVTSTVSWIGAFVFRSNDNEDDRIPASQTTTPLLTGHYEAALQLPSSSFEITPPQIPFTKAPVTGTGVIESSDLTPKASKLVNRLPPGVGVVSTVKDENCSLIYRNDATPPSIPTAITTSSANSSATTSPLQPSSTKSQPGSANTSPLRPGLVFAGYQQHHQQKQVQASPPASIVPQFRFPLVSGNSSTQQHPPSPSPSPIPSFLSFLTSREQPPSERKHRAFSIPGTDSEKLAAVAATTAARANTALSKAAGLMSEFERNENSIFFAGNSTAASSSGAGRRKGVSFSGSDQMGNSTKPDVVVVGGSAGASPKPPVSVLPSVGDSENPAVASPPPVLSRRDEIFGKVAANSSTMVSPTSRRDEIFGKVSSGGAASSGGVAGAVGGPLLGSPTSRRAEIFGKGVVPAAVAAEASSSSYRPPGFVGLNFPEPALKPRASSATAVITTTLAAPLAYQPQPMLPSASSSTSNATTITFTAATAATTTTTTADPQERRGSLSFWDLRKRLLQQETMVEGSVEDDDDEDERKSKSSQSSSYIPFKDSSLAWTQQQQKHQQQLHQQTAPTTVEQSYYQQQPVHRQMHVESVECDSECSGDGFESDESENEDDEYWSCGSSEDEEERQQGRWGAASCFGGIFRSSRVSNSFTNVGLNGGGGASGSTGGGVFFSQWFGRGNDEGRGNNHLNNSQEEQEEFEGHYILFIGYDAKTDGFIYRDPGTEERLCVMDSAAVEYARAGVPGPYKWFVGYCMRRIVADLVVRLPGLEYNGTRVTNDIWTAVNMSNYISDFFRPTAFGVWYWEDISADLAVQNINADPTILPGIHINIKRFNDRGPPFKSPGYTMAETMPEIEADPNIVAIFGDFDRKTTTYSAEMMSLAQLPFCGVETFSFPMLNRYKYPYLMQIMSISGFGETLYQLLLNWNVQRIAILYSYSNKDMGGSALHAADYISARGINVLIKMNSDLGSQPGGIEYIAQMLKIVDARYIVICTDVFSIANVYYSLAARNASVGPGYVWIGNGPPVDMGEGMAGAYGRKDFYKWSKGFYFVNGANPTSEYTYHLGENVTAQINSFTAPFGAHPQISDLWNINIPEMYDCIGLFAAGFKKLLTSNPKFTPEMLATRQLQQYMNATLFADTGYRGLGGDPIQLSKFGDLAAPGMVNFLPGDMVFPDPVAVAVTNMDWTTFNYLPNTTLLFYDGSSTPPPDGPIYTEHLLLPSNGEGQALIALGGLGIIFSFFSLFITLACQKTSTIRNGSVMFLSFIAIGSAFPYASLFFHVYRATSFSCNARIWLPLIGFSIVFGSILVKNMRMHIIFTPEYSFPPHLLKDWCLVVVLALLIGFEALFVGLFAGNSPMHGIYTLGQDLTFTYACSFAPRELTYPSILLWVYNALLLIGTFAAGLLTWNVKPQFNESTYIYLISMCTGVLSLLLLGIGQSKDTSTLSNFVQGIMVWVITAFTMMLLFGPKILVLVFDAKDGGLSSTFMSSLRSSMGGTKSTMGGNQTKTMIANNNAGRKRIASQLESSHAPGQSYSMQTSSIAASTASKYAKPILQNSKYGVCYTRKGKNGLGVPWTSAVLGMYAHRERTTVVFMSMDEASWAINLPKNVMLHNVIELKDENHVQYRVGLKCEATKVDIKIDFKKSDQAEEVVMKLKELLKQQKE
ncbi:UNVERIFIED_CONTAM: hypothetical protein HDU68_000074 [Siphonaria sp. JEL0065]|nr:hypothetical protein HDU68_000074 [Siphonaria sp. JEL0065]